MEVKLNTQLKEYICNKENSKATRKTKAELDLWFASGEKTELIQTNFRCPLLYKEVCAVRGKTAGAFSTDITFQWTSAVQSICVLLLKASALAKEGKGIDRPIMEGYKGSMAASLDDSLYKQTAWLSLFGANIKGDSLSKRLFPRTNPGRRRFGPVSISLNEKVLKAENINIYMNSQLISNTKTILECVSEIERKWQIEKDSKIRRLKPLTSNVVNLHEIPQSLNP